MKRQLLALCTGLILLGQHECASADTWTNPPDVSDQGCINTYYGLGERVDFAKAYKCFELQDVFEFMILMQLNGQGVPADATKARMIMEQWRKDNPDYADQELFPANSRVLKILNDKKALVPPTPSLDYCKDVATSNVETTFCLDIEDRLGQQESDKIFAGIRAHLSTEDARLWDRIIKVFKEYVDAEGARADALYYGGSGAPSADLSQRIYVRKSFVEAVKAIFVKMNLKPSSKVDLARSEAEMKAAFDVNIGQYGTASAPSTSRNSASADEKRWDKMDTEAAAQYKVAAIASQKKWLALRELCSQLATHLYKGPEVDWSVSLDKAFTVDRTTVIEHPI